MSLVFNMVGGGGGIRLSSIAIRTPPEQTTYTTGDLFNPTGMVVEAVYSNGAAKEVTEYSFSPSAELTSDIAAITIRYTENGVSKTAYVPVKVRKQIVYHGTAESLSAARSRISAVSIGGYALFAGGCRGNDSAMDTVDAYDAQLTRSNPAVLATPQSTGDVARVGGYAVFAGGYKTTLAEAKPADTTVYDETLTRVAHPELNISRVYAMAAASTERHAVFGGGDREVDISLVGTVDAIDEHLVKSVPVAFGVARGYYAAASHQGYAMFAGGDSSTSGAVYRSEVDVYGQDLEKLQVPNLAVAAICMGAAAAGEGYVLFAGGQSADGGTAAVNAYSPDLTRVLAPELSAARWCMYGAAFDGRALFAGGYVSADMPCVATVDCYDEELTHTTLMELSAARNSNSPNSRYGAVAGEFALFAGGQNADGWLSTVDAYTLI